MCAGDSLGARIAAAFRRDEDGEAGTGRDAVPLSTRKRLWELESKHHCPIVGICLSLAELTQLARRLGFGGAEQDEFTLHVEAVGFAGTRNPVSLSMQRHLDRKYAVSIGRFEQAKSSDAVLALWRECYARGEIAGPLWAALTHRAAGCDARQTIYGDIHMLSHQVGAGQAAAARRCAHLAAENRLLAARVERTQRERTRTETELRAQVATLTEQTTGLRRDEQETQALRERVAALESGVAMVSMGRRLLSLTALTEQLRADAQRAQELERKLTALAAELRTLRRERDQLARERDRLERQPLGEAADDGECEGACDACEINGAARNILCVGGRTGLVHQYRQLAQRLGIRLLHHDGGREESLSRLPDLINGADAVLCPTDCVSHSAYYQLKQHCKRSGKPCLLFKGSGVSSFALALDRLATGSSSLGRSGRGPEPHISCRPKEEE